MGRLMALLGMRLTPKHGAVAARLFAWPADDLGPSGASLPLRLAGGLHALRLMDRAALAPVYPPHAPSEDVLWSAISAALVAEEAFLLDWIDRAPQTNEPRRSAALRAAGQWLAARFRLPLDVMELGASAGLNLGWDRFALDLEGTRFGPSDAIVTLAPEWDGPLPPAVEPVIARRSGVDLHPADPVRDALRLRAYLWPDQPDRMARLDALLALPPNPVDPGDAGDWLDAKLAAPPEQGTCRLICHTVAWQYFPEATAARARAAIERAGAAATPSTPLAWFGMEADGPERGAGLTMRVWPGGETQAAGRADFHGRWVSWRLG